MKKRFRLLAAVLAAVITCSVLLSGCGKSAPTATDAQKYVQAVLDLMCTGDYDKSVKFADVEEGKELEMRDQMIDEMLASVSQDAGFGEDIQARFREFIVKAFASCKYTVGEPVKTDDSGKTGYDVPVTIEPLKIFAGASESLEAEMTELTSDTEKLMEMTEDEMYGVIFDALFKVLDGNLENPQYGAGEEIVVHYGLLDEKENLYGLDEEAGSRLGEKLFSMEGLEE